MKYLTQEVLAGSKAHDAAEKTALENQIENLEDRRAEIYGQWQSEQKTIEDVCAALLMRIQDGHEVSKHELEKAFAKPSAPGRWSTEYYGLDKNSLDNIEKEITKAQDRLNNWEPSHLTQFLETVHEEWVTDYGVRTAGFGGIALGRLVLAGRRAAA